MQYLVSFLVIQSYSERERETETETETETEIAVCLNVIVILMSCDCDCSMAPPQCALGWSAVCDCDNSWSYSLTFLPYIKVIH